MASKSKGKKPKTVPRAYADVTRKAKPGPVVESMVSSVGSSFWGRLQPYNPDDLVGKKSLGIYRKMGTDEQVKAALYSKVFAVLSSGWEIRKPTLPEEEGEIASELQRYTEWNFNEMAGHFDSKLQEALTALMFGFAVAEKVFWLSDYGEFAERVCLRDLKFRNPEGFEFASDEHGNLERDGIIQHGRRLPTAKFFLYSYMKKFDNYYGESDLRAAYRGYWLKDVVLKYMAIGLERYGEPIADISHEGSITTTQRSMLEAFLKNVQSRSGLIHDDKIELKFHSPTFRADVYTSAVSTYDTLIRVAILMPGLMGMSAEQQVGSLARSGTEFNVFLWIINQLRLDLETAINEQIVKPLVDLNYEVGGGRYPTFAFREIDREREAQIYDMWLAGVTSGVLKKFPEDENKQRVALGLAEKTEEELAPEPEPEPFGAEEDIFGGFGSEEETDLEDRLALMSDEQLAKIAAGDGDLDEGVVVGRPEYFTCSYCGLRRTCQVES